MPAGPDPAELERAIEARAKQAVADALGRAAQSAAAEARGLALLAEAERLDAVTDVALTGLNALQAAFDDEQAQRILLLLT